MQAVADATGRPIEVSPVLEASGVPVARQAHFEETWADAGWHQGVIRSIRGEG